MSSAAKTKRDKLEAREANILAAARRVFIVHGYHGAKMSMIAKESGVAEGTLYLYYKNKNAIVSAVVKRHWDMLTQGAGKIINGPDDSYEKLEAFATYHLERLVTEWRIVELGYVQHYGADASYGDTLNFIRSYAMLLDGIIEQGMDRGLFNSATDKLFIRDLFFGTLEYSARSALMRGEHINLDAVTEHLMGVLKASLSNSTLNQPNSLQYITKRLGDITDRLEAINT